MKQSSLYSAQKMNFSIKDFFIFCAVIDMTLSNAISLQMFHNKMMINALMTISTSYYMFGKAIWDKLPECIFINFQKGDLHQKSPEPNIWSMINHTKLITFNSGQLQNNTVNGLIQIIIDRVIIHITRLVLDIVNIMKVTRTVVFMKPRVGFIFFVTNNNLTFFLPIYIIVSLAIHYINHIGKSDKNPNNK